MSEVPLYDMHSELQSVTRSGGLTVPHHHFFFFFIILGPELSDTNVYEP